jgi:hypothetical protein
MLKAALFPAILRFSVSRWYAASVVTFPFPGVVIMIFQMDVRVNFMVFKTCALFVVDVPIERGVAIDLRLEWV